QALEKVGHQAEIITMPFKWYPPERIPEHILASRLLDISETCGEKIDLMIIESMHIIPEEIYEAFIKIKPKKLLLTHIDDTLERKLKNWHKKLSEAEKRKILLCYDGMILKFAVK
ncbi:MAG: hypothetical protein QHH13_06965, partial [Melioribacter sp.]|nr:hypothetical protein [Melioribacter sp.]